MKTLPIRSAAVIAAVYGYFLIFAQFAFVEIMRSDFLRRPSPASLSHGTEEKWILGMMAAAGIVSGFLVAWRGITPGKIRLGLILAATASVFAPWARGTYPLIAVAIVTGSGLGLSTVCLATLVRNWCGLAWIGLGTGVGYALCNLPFVFSRTPSHQAWIAAAFALVGAACVPSRADAPLAPPAKIFPLPSAILIFTALVWLDSAAFFVIQHVPDFKAGTWGDAALWRNAAVHLGAALIGGWWLRKAGGRILPSIAWLLLAVAAMAVNSETFRPVCGWLYPAAVSLYSTALVAWPGWFSGASDRCTTGWHAAWLYAVAGWFGSANGIGMAQSLQRVPLGFVLISGLCVVGVMLASLRKSRRPIAFVALVMAPALLTTAEKPASGNTPAERGKQVYIAEGCIHCHSQYVRPGTLDEDLWGPPAEKIPSSHPVLIGNRRQGPDLSNIGARRSEMWLKQHFISPSLLSPGSTMPSYAHLFEDNRGSDLVAYLRQSGSENVVPLVKKSAEWIPSTIITSDNARALFTNQCSACHGSEGRGDGELAKWFERKPANLIDGPFVWSPPTPDQSLKLARIVKFGIPGTDMPGHETLSDPQVLALRDYVINLRRHE